jgi:hypothetical protein
MSNLQETLGGEPGLSLPNFFVVIQASSEPYLVSFWSWRQDDPSYSVIISNDSIILFAIGR